MSVLNRSTVYLAGPIDFAKDHGVSWRQKITPWLSELGIRVLDPTNKPHNFISETSQEKDYINTLKREERWDELTDFMKRIRRVDLRAVDVSDFVIAYLNLDIFSTGTFNEIYMAENQQKPVLIIMEGGIQKLPGWLFAVVRPEEVFSDTEECADYLKKINNKEIEIDDRWVLFNQKEEIYA